METKIEILQTPKILTEEYKKFKTKDIILQQIVDNFTFVLERELSKENLTLFYNNISTLKLDYKSIIQELKYSLFKKNIITGYYFLAENIISVIPLNNRKYLNISIEEYIANICHELLHMSSTIIDEERKISFSGFCQISDNSNIGLSIDDAYTEILAYRYFNLNKNYMSYDYEVIITTLIEEIVGKDTMTSLYFNADLYNLIIELQKYNSNENITKFLDDLDSIYALRDHSRGYKKDIIYYHNEISNFIINTYINKLKDNLTKGIITKRDYDISLDKCSKNIHEAFNKLEIIKTRKRTRRNIF